MLPAQQVVSGVIPGQTNEQTAVAIVKLDGLDIEFGEDGDWNKMYATYRQPVAFPDRQGFRRAYTIAEERAKAQVSRFISQQVQSERLVTQVDSSLQLAQRSQVGEADAISKSTQRTTVESVREFTRSFSEATLRGLTVVEQGYDEAAEEVWVTVGLSKSTIQISNRLRSALQAPSAPESGEKRSGGTSPQAEATRRKIP
ncbi:MAG: hypothetical protein FJ361_03585 [Gemmatimonadetes bacterium]|nr:hypothetical protein [Gemmatimonadota bacterium]